MFSKSVVSSFVALSLIASQSVFAKSLPPGMSEGTSNIILLLDISDEGSGDLIENGSFEDDAGYVRVSGSHTTPQISSMTGWTLSYGQGFELQRNWGASADGLNHIELDGRANAGMYQNVQTNGTGNFLLEFDYKRRGGSATDTDEVEIYWNNQLLGSVGYDADPTYNHSSRPWQTYSYEVTGAGSTTRLEFRAAGTSDSGGGYVDNVRLTELAAENLVTNGSFEDDYVGSWAVFGSLTGWSLASGAGIELQSFGAAADGNNRIELDSHNNSSMYQDIPTNGTGEFLLEYSYTPRPGVNSASNTIDVYWNGEKIDSVTGYSSTEAWETRSHTVEGAGTTTRLEFRAAGTSDSLGGYLDNIVVTNNSSYAGIEIINEISADSALAGNANFGLIEWNDTATVTVPVSSTGASEILARLENITFSGEQNFNDAIAAAGTHLTSLDDSSNSCHRNIVIVITDGSWEDSSGINAAESLYLTEGIETYFIILDSSQDINYFTTASSATGTSGYSPVVSDDWEAAYNTVYSYIADSFTSGDTSSYLTYSAPTIVPGLSGEAAILQSTFMVSSDHQWKGRLKKYSMTSSGGIGSEVWDAGELLNDTAANDRNIWTVVDGNADINFTTSNRTSLASSLNENLSTDLTDTELDNLIDFIRGKDSYDEFTTGVDDEGDTLISGERWKLSDIYNSEAVYVGPPSAYSSDESNVNSEAYYRFNNGYNDFKYSNSCGTACNERQEVVFVGSNGGMLHAFDYNTGNELWAFIPPSLLPSLKDVITTTDGQTEAIYGVDGTPNVKDIYYDGSWRTVLMAGLRQGGHSYFALDITDVTNPKHLFTIAHNTVNETSSYWDENGTRTTNLNSSNPAVAYNYSNLGEAWSDPIMFLANIDGTQKWVSTIAGGYNGGNSSYGTHLFVLDLENQGQVLNTVSLPDTDSGNSIVSSLPPRITAITSDSTTLFTDSGAILYITSLEGELWKVNMTGTGTLYETTRIFDAESTNSNGRYAYHRLESTIANGNSLMHFFGTGNILDPNNIDATIENRIYGIIDGDFPTYASSSLYTASDLQVSDGTCPSDTQKGWYYNLGSYEKVTGSMTIMGESVLTPVYTPDNSGQCNSGEAKIVESNLLCGTSETTHIIGVGIPTRAVVYNNKVYMGVNSDDSSTVSSGVDKVGNLVTVAPSTTVAPRAIIESWTEEF